MRFLAAGAFIGYACSMTFSHVGSRFPPLAVVEMVSCGQPIASSSSITHAHSQPLNEPVLHVISLYIC